MKAIFIHGIGHKSTSWKETISYLENAEEVLCPELSSLLNGKEASYDHLYASFREYCRHHDGPFHLCGISLGGILALNYALEFPEQVKSLVLIGTPHKIPKVLFGIQNMVYRFVSESMFENMAFDKKDTLILSRSMKALDFRKSMNRVNCPTLLICGEKDSANMKSAQYFHETIPNSKLKVIEDAGHVVNEEKPQALAQVLNEFYHR